MNLLIDIFITIKSILIQALPEYTGMSTGMHDSIETVFGAINSISGFLPTGTFWAIMFLLIGTELTILGFKVTKWALRWK